MFSDEVGEFWDSPGVARILPRVVDRAARVLRARSVVVVAVDPGGERPLVHRAATDRGLAYACWLARKVSDLGRSLSVARVPRASRAWLGPDSVAAYAAIPLKTHDGEVVGAVIAFDVDAREWDESALEDLEETSGFLFAALESPATSGVFRVAVEAELLAGGRGARVA